MARKPNFTRKKTRKVHGEAFWDAEYKNPTHLKLSTKQSEDLEKFTRWVGRRKREDVLSPAASVLDVGCGNGRNLIFLSQNFGTKGVGYDISKAAVSQALTASKGLPIKYTARSIAGPLDVLVSYLAHQVVYLLNTPLAVLRDHLMCQITHKLLCST